jgi:hypothetical protein
MKKGVVCQGKSPQKFFDCHLKIKSGHLILPCERHSLKLKKEVLGYVSIAQKVFVQSA